MRRFLLYIIPILTLVILLLPVLTYAQTSVAPVTASNPGWFSSILDDVGIAVGTVVKYIALGILLFFSWLLSISAILLNYAIAYLVIGMGDLIRNGGFGVQIEALWKVIRDLINVSFIFALIYIGITTILSIGGVNWKSALKNLIVCALLVNFSLFFSKVIIDVANVTADSIYKQMLGVSAGATLTNPNSGLSGAFMAKMGMTGILTGQTGSPKILEKAQGAKDGIAFTIVYALGSSILFFKLAFAFGLATFLLVIRFVMLILLMIFSPIAFLPSVLPGFKKYASQWWTGILGQAFMAPVFIFGLYIAYTILDKAPWNAQGGLDQLFLGEDATKAFGALLYYVIAIIMIIGTTMMAKKMSAMGAEYAATLGKSAEAWTKKGLSTYMAPARLAGRAGAGAGKATGSFLARKPIGWTATKLGKFNEKLEGTKYGRAAKIVTTGLTLGALNERNRQALIKKGKTSKFGGSYSYQDDKDFKKAQGKTQVTQERRIKREEAIDLYERKKEELDTNAMSGGIATADEEKELADVLKAATDEIQKMTSTELEEQSVGELQKIAGLLSNKQMDSIKDSKEAFNEGAKTKIKDAREQYQLQAVGTVHEDGPDKGKLKTVDAEKMKTFFKGMKPEDMAKLPKAILKTDEALEHFTGDMLRRLHENNVFTIEEAAERSQALRKAHQDAEKKLEEHVRDKPAPTTDAEREVERVLEQKRNRLKSSVNYIDTARGQQYYGFESARERQAREKAEEARKKAERGQRGVETPEERQSREQAHAQQQNTVGGMFG